MLDKDDVIKRFEKNDISVFFAEPPLKITLLVEFKTLDDFIGFASKSDIKSVLMNVDVNYKEYIDDKLLEDLDVTEEEKRAIKKDVEKYNEKIQQIDDIVYYNLTVFFFINNVCYQYDDIYDFYEENDVDYPQDYVVELLDSNEEVAKIIEKKNKHYAEQKQEEYNAFKKRLSELKDKILDDDNFATCTNQSLRSMYLKQFMIQEQISSSFFVENGVYPRQFMDYVWNEFKMKKAKKS